jgi:hypothetical protein
LEDFLMKRFSRFAAVLVAVGSLIYTPAFTQDAQKKEQTRPIEGEKPKKVPTRIKVNADGKQISPYSLAVRTANNRADCKPNALKPDGVGIHGHYRGYGAWDPELKSIEGRKQFEACVKRGLEPAPWFALLQRATYAQGGKFFGKTKEDCLKCHVVGY